MTMTPKTTTDIKTITIIPGDGIGGEITASTLEILDSMDLPLAYEVFDAGLDHFNATGIFIPDACYESFEKNGIALKGPTTTPVGTGHSSLNVLLRKKYDLYANVRPVKSIVGVPTPFSNIDLVIFRENTEDLYAGLETQVSADECHGIKVITRKASSRIAKAAFDYARTFGKGKVTAVHKANIMKKSDGLFLEAVRAVAADYPEIALEEVIVDNMCMQLVRNPQKYSVIVTSNLYGDILSDLCAGLVGGLGVVPGANIGSDKALFEAVHGTAPDIVGKGVANPTAMLLSAAMMLDHLGLHSDAERLTAAVMDVIGNDPGSRTPDLGGNGTTATFTQAVIGRLKG